jgi:general secretion pathway protein N
MIGIKITQRGRRLILLGVACYIVFLFVTLPASFLTSYILPSIDSARSVKLQSVSGNVWKGHAANARVGSFNLGQLDWDLSALGLLLGDVDLEFRFRDQDTSGAGDVSLGFTGTTQASDVELSFSAESLQPLIYGFPISISGKFRGTINELEYTQGDVLKADGRIVWQSAALRAPQNIELGDFLLTLSPHNTGTKVKITDSSQGPVKAEINIKLDGKGKYNMNGWLQARDEGQQHITEALRIIGKADSTGKFWVSYNGFVGKQQRGRRR